MNIYRYLIDGNPSDIYYKILPYMLCSIKQSVLIFSDYQIVCQDDGKKSYFKVTHDSTKEIAPQDMTGAIIGSKTLFKINNTIIDIDNINKKLMFLSSTVDISNFNLGFKFSEISEELLSILYISIKDNYDN